MTTPHPETCTALSRLRAAMDETAAALATADLDRLLAADAALQAALTELPARRAVDLPERPQVRVELELARAALLRCRRLGASLTDFVRLSLDARGLGYEPERMAAAALAGAVLNERA